MIALVSELTTQFHRDLASSKWLRALARFVQQAIAAHSEFQAAEGAGVISSAYNEDRYMGPNSAVKYHFIVKVSVARINLEQPADTYIMWVRYLPSVDSFEIRQEVVETLELREERRKRGEVRLSGIEANRESYLEIIRSLPPPTPGQTALFASYVADAHSWYKHLPLGRKVPFVFFLDPHAGKHFARDIEGNDLIVPIEDTAHHIHYTAQKTTDYRRRFGFWNYHAAYGTSLMYRAEGNVIDTRSQGLRIVGDQGQWVPVPVEVLEMGRAEVNALIHFSKSFGIWERDLGGNPDPDLPDYAPGRFPRLEAYIQSLGSKGKDLPEIPSQLRQAVERLDRQHFLWDSDDLIERLLAAETSEGRAREQLFPALLEHLEFRRIGDEFESLLATERIRQLRELRAAMHRVVKFVYGETEGGWQ